MIKMAREKKLSDRIGEYILSALGCLLLVIGIIVMFVSYTDAQSGLPPLP